MAGAEYKRMLQAHGVHPLLAESISGKATAMCLCLVTPDGQRTMRTYLGAALDMQKAAEGFPPSNLSLCHFEGYSLYRPGVAVGAMRTVRTAGGRVSLDLASFEVVRNCWKALKDILEAGLVDILFCNEDEAVALGDVAGLLKGEGSHPSSIESHYDGKASTIEAVCGYFLQFVSVVVISRGKDGCTAAARGGHRASVTAADVAVKDTVGAGDFFSAGFLHAWLQNAPLETCARCGCAAGAAAVQATGAELGPTAMQQLQQTVVELLQQSNGGAGTLQP